MAEGLGKYIFIANFFLFLASLFLILASLFMKISSFSFLSPFSLSLYLLFCFLVVENFSSFNCSCQLYTDSPPLQRFFFFTICCITSLLISSPFFLLKPTLHLSPMSKTLSPFYSGGKLNQRILKLFIATNFPIIPQH